MADAVAKIETLKVFIKEEKTSSEELNKLLFVKQSEVEKLKEEIESKVQEHTDYKKEMLRAINQTKEETKAVKKKQEKRDSERDGKRKVIVFSSVKALFSRVNVIQIFLLIKLSAFPPSLSHIKLTNFILELKTCKASCLEWHRV
jgi:hypothetical protein